MTAEVERLTSLLAYARESRDAYAAEVERLRVERDQARKERDRAREATIARVRTLADSWDDVIAVERHLHGDRSARLVADAQADLLAAIEGVDS